MVTTILFRIFIFSSGVEQNDIFFEDVLNMRTSENNIIKTILRNLNFHKLVLILHCNFCIFFASLDFFFSQRFKHVDDFQRASEIIFGEDCELMFPPL